ncbi:nucleoside deaminase [Bradyrhizobium cenepequi]|uniref:nucleoside deaminase n=1 Tax=Bradyrhizobium cenepequi TaxID=2821403 RepID=UPI001CE397FD|nr:nucleoside deaminase [Bradyrhizobium cenepequi]MCA6109065.1 nucleoside deaminase [Bradyrhizobium cenepequi]
MTIEQYHYDFMAEAIREAEIGISEGGLPIGAVLTRDNKVIARGHNRRMQEKNVILHGEMSCFRDAGLISFHDTVMYTTLSPCSMCAGAIGLFKLKLLVIGESVTFPGSKDILTQFGIPFIDLADDRSSNMMKNWRSDPANERTWQGDIGN